MSWFRKKPKKEIPEQVRRQAPDMARKYEEQLAQRLGGDQPPQEAVPISSREYKQFKESYMPKHLSWYEKACNFSEKLLKIAPDKKKIPDYEEAIRICHLNVTPTGITSFALLSPLTLALLGAFISLGIFGSFFFTIFFLVIGLLLYPVLQTFPKFSANAWRMKSSNQMVVCIFYIVTYMRHTSNLERAIQFATEHLAPPLSLDLRKVLWDVETEYYESVKVSLETYLATWKKWNGEFVSAFHLVEASLYEGDEQRRLATLDKAMSSMLDETYEKMLHYAQNLKSPITMLHMLGIILPILGLVMLPLVVSFMCSVQWYHLFAVYNLALPVGVMYMAKTILATRPTGYGESDIADTNPELKKYKNVIFNIGKKEIKITPLVFSILFMVLFVSMGILPLALHLISSPEWDIIYTEQGMQLASQLQDPKENFAFLGYKPSAGCPVGKEGTGNLVGPFGLGAGIFSLFLVLGVGAGVGLYYKLRSKNLLNIRNQAKKLEQEFASALFQLGNRLGDGLPVEIAFGKVAEVMEDTMSGKFFRLVSANISRLGMSVEEAIFDPQHGALVYFPSKIIASSMKVLVESAKKGPRIAANAVINVSNYIKEIHRVNERLKDLMADIISSMKSQIKFLTPVISGIVIGITSMITTILGKLRVQLANISGDAGGVAMIKMFGDGIPSFYFQIMVGLYVVEIIFILTIMSTGIESGSDKLKEQSELGKNLIRGSITYLVVALSVMLIFNLIAAKILIGVAT
jgi:hypothetical protein